MHPLHVAHGVLSLDVGGLERIVLALARTAREQGHRVSVVCVERRGKLYAEAEAAGATVVSLDKPAGRLPEYATKARAALDELRPDVLHTHQIGAAWYLGRAAADRGGPPVLHTEHGNVFANHNTWWQAAKARLFFRRAARTIDRFCCVSDEIAAEVTRWRTVPRRKVEVVPNGIATDPPADLPPAAEVRAALGIPADAAVVGTVGRLAEEKRQDRLVRAAAGLRDAVPGLRLLLVGDGDRRAELEQLARDCGVADRVHFAGYQNRPEKYLQVMDVFALTSRTEGFPVSLLEAWLAGVPVVCSAVGGIPSVVTHGADGLLFPPDDEAALTAALRRVLEDRPLRERLAAAGGRAVRERYSLRRIADEYEERYRSLVAGRAAG